MSDRASGEEAIRRNILPAFELDPEAVSLAPLSGGLINDTYCVQGGASSWVLQRLNPEVFPDPAGVMANLRHLLNHFESKLSEQSGLTLPDIHTTLTGADFLQDEAGVFWRGLALIPRARNLRGIKQREEAVEVGRALGWFHRMTESLPCDLLADTLPGFHETPRYLERWDQALELNGAMGSIDGIQVAYIDARREAAGALELARERGVLKVRVMHGDPKLDNVLFSESEIRAISLIDLDTVKPGLIHYDLGDCFRSCCNVSGEAGNSKVRFDLEIFEAVLDGYFLEAAASLTRADLDYIYTATWLLPYELGTRFLTDHLKGDLYFKVSRRGENLERALRQFELVRDIEQKQTRIEQVIEAAWARV